MKASAHLSLLLETDVSAVAPTVLGKKFLAELEVGAFVGRPSPARPSPVATGLHRRHSLARPSSEDLLRPAFVGAPSSA